MLRRLVCKTVLRAPSEVKRWQRTQLKYPLQQLPPPASSGFLAPLGNTEGLPFQVERTTSNNLPVYTDYRNGRTRERTILRKIKGDEMELSQELSALLGGVEVYHYVGRIEVKGLHSTKIRTWLQQLGF